MDRKNFFKKGIWKALKGSIEKTEETYEIVTKTFKEEIIIKVDSKKETKLEPNEEKKETIHFPEVLKPKRKFKNLSPPPGASKSLEVYKKKCTGCGDCIHACPYNTIFPVYDSKLNKNIAFIDTNQNACLMCIDYPCINSCEEDALKPLGKKKLKIGKAKLRKDTCLNIKNEENTCRVCAQSCPVPEVITYSKKQLPVFSNDCTGCGICVQNCPTFPKAILIEF
jgi:ferredoxin-type protein NapG